MIPEIKRQLIEVFTLDGDSIEAVGVLFDLSVEEVDDSNSPLIEYHVRCISRDAPPKAWLFKFRISHERMATEHKDSFGRVERARHMIIARLHDWLHHRKDPGDEIDFERRIAEIEADRTT